MKRVEGSFARERPKHKGDMRFVINVVFWIGSTLFGLFLLLVYGPFLLGWSSYLVLSPSMAPVIEPGSIVVVRPAGQVALQQNDIVAYRKNNAIVLHRIQQVQEENGKVWFVLKGDANEYADFETVTEKQIIGKMAYSIPYAGYVVKYVSDNKVLLLILVVLVFLLFHTMVTSRRRPRRTTCTTEPVKK